jgi:hypothetical protein
MLFISLFVSCRNNIYHIYIDSPNDNLELSDNLFIDNDEQFRIIYSIGIQDNKLIINLSNLTNSALYLNLEKSFISINGDLYRYSRNASASGSSDFFSNYVPEYEEELLIQVLNPLNYPVLFSTYRFDFDGSQNWSEENQKIRIPSRSSRTIAEILLKDLINVRLESMMLQVRRNIFPLKFDSFDSPLRLTNRFNLTIGASALSRTVINSFYVSEISVFR